MKRISIIITLLLLMPILVHAETITYNVCESGCSYNNLESLLSYLSGISDINNDITINLEKNKTYNLGDSYQIVLSQFAENEDAIDYTNKTINGNYIVPNDQDKLVINGNGSTILCENNNCSIGFAAASVEINDLFFEPSYLEGNFESLDISNTPTIQVSGDKVVLNNIKTPVLMPSANKCLINDSNTMLLLAMLGNNTINKSYIGTYIIFIANQADIFDSNIDNVGGLMASIGSLNFHRTYVKHIEQIGFEINFYDSEIGKIANMSKINIYNPTNKDRITHFKGEMSDIYQNYPEFDQEDDSTWGVNIYDIYSESGDSPAEGVYTHIYYTKNIEMELNSEKEYKNILDEMSGGRELTYNIEDNSIVDLQGDKLKAKKLGQTTLHAQEEDETYNYLLYITVYVLKEEKSGVVLLKTQSNQKINLISVFEELADYEGELEWEVDNPEVVEVQKNEIIPLRVGETDVHTLANNNKFNYHVTVVDTTPEKIMHTSIKVPITGKRIKLWIIASTILLLGVIISLLYCLIKLKKS